MDSSTAAVRLAVAKHEWGHILGLKDRSGTPASIMRATCCYLYALPGLPQLDVTVYRCLWG